MVRSNARKRREPLPPSLGLTWGANLRGGRSHIEWHWDCDGRGNGCALHPITAVTGELSPHIHHCPRHGVAFQEQADG